MALSKTGKAISSVTALLVSWLSDAVKNQVTFGGPGGTLDVKEGKPEPALTDVEKYKRRLNIFLYEARFDPSLKNVPLEEGQPEPMWLVLRYLLTAYDVDGNSDTLKAHEILGEGIRALQKLNYLQIKPLQAEALRDNPEPLKITFNEATVELLSKLMQGGDEKYRFSFVFEVRPVMIAIDKPPEHNLLVGIDYTQIPPKAIEEKEQGVQIPVIPTMGPEITSISPSGFEVEENVTLKGNNLDQSGLTVQLGSANLGATAQTPGELQFKVKGKIGEGKIISAGSLPVTVVKELPYGRTRNGNYLTGNLLPILTGFTKGALANIIHPAGSAKEVVTGTLELQGTLLGTKRDDIILSFYRNGKVETYVQVNGCEIPIPPTPQPLQKTLEVVLKKEDKVAPGTYRMILTVNGKQARNSPQVTLP